MKLAVMLQAAKQTRCNICLAPAGDECEDVEGASYMPLTDEDGEVEYVHGGRVEEACRIGLLDEKEMP